jgi:hypothetical protein
VRVPRSKVSIIFALPPSAGRLSVSSGRIIAAIAGIFAPASRASPRPAPPNPSSNFFKLAAPTYPRLSASALLERTRNLAINFRAAAGNFRPRDAAGFPDAALMPLLWSSGRFTGLFAAGDCT